jgi:hypothetical protein
MRERAILDVEDAIGELFRARALGRVPADQNAAFARRRQACYCAKPAAAPSLAQVDARSIL